MVTIILMLLTASEQSWAGGMLAGGFPTYDCYQRFDRDQLSETAQLRIQVREKKIQFAFLNAYEQRNEKDKVYYGVRDYAFQANNPAFIRYTVTNGDRDSTNILLNRAMIDRSETGSVSLWSSEEGYVSQISYRCREVDSSRWN